MYSKSLLTLSLAGLLLASTVQAQGSSGIRGLGDSLKGLAGPSATIAPPASVGNAAGLLNYCVKNHYLDSAGSQVDQLQSKLLGKNAGQIQSGLDQDPSYQDGVNGILHDKNGRSLNLDMLKGKYKDKLSSKICKLALDKGRSVL